MGDDAVRAGDIIHRFRNFFRHGATQLRFTDLAPLFDSAIAAQKQRADSLGLRLQRAWPGTLPKVLIDSIQMEVVLRNLVANAMDAISPSGPDGSVTLRAARQHDTLLVEVVDSGPGVTAAQALKIFDGVDSEKPGGMGIGLSICRSIVEAHGGRLWAETGTCGHFCFTLPLDMRADDHPETTGPRRAR
mgnify:CR=1 FL=1